MVGDEQQSEELVKYLLGEYEGNTEKLWESNIFGKSVFELVNEGLSSKLKRMPEDARNIVLMYWLLGMSDREIGAYLNVPRRSANQSRQASYRMLKKLMGGKADE